VFASSNVNPTPPAQVGSPPRRALLCIERPEEMGRLNITPTEITLVGASEGPNGNASASLIGGQNACFRTHGHAGRLKVRFPYPYGGPGEPVRYWTASFPVTIKAGENSYELSVDEGQPDDGKEWNRVGWHGLWKLEPVSKFCRSASQWTNCPDPGGE
jgi:hypothetical protein